MNKKSILLMLLLTLPLMAPLIVRNATAYPVTGTPSTTPKIIEWTPTGLTEYATLKWNPEYLKLEVLTPIHTVTTVIVQGKDTYGANIEAKVVIPPGVPLQSKWIFNDTHTDPPKPVAFAEITGILQQNGTDNSKFAIYTEPEPFEEYLGQFHNSTGFEPGKYDYWGDTRQYLVGQGENIPYTVQDVPVEPSNPDPFKIAVNWADKQLSPPIRVRDLLPQADEFPTGGAGAPSTIWLESLNENGDKVITRVDITQGTTLTATITGCTYSTLCKVWGGNQGDSYYIFTEPMPERKLFYYYILIDHITIHPASYDILAYPDVIEGVYPGVTSITVALRDIDGNLVHAGDYGKLYGSIDAKIVINFFTSGGKIQPSNDVHIEECHVSATVNLTADTNARTIKVTADANIPKCTWHDEMNLFTWTEMTFDGINSVFSEGGVVVHAMMWGYTDVVGNVVTKPVPPKPVLPPELGGPAADGIKLDGPIYEVTIPLYVGCNLISTPVSPLFSDKYYANYPTTVEGADGYNAIGVDNKGIPMDLLFGKTSALDNIEAIWWYDAERPTEVGEQYPPPGDWHVYVPGVTLDGDAYFTDGVGYWIKAEKPCTLEISGVWMENGPFTPPTYELDANAWNLKGVTSLTGISISDYLSSVSGSQYIQGAGPVWVYYARDGRWVRNPSWGLWPGEAFWVYNKLPEDLYLAP